MNYFDVICSLKDIFELLPLINFMTKYLFNSTYN